MSLLGRYLRWRRLRRKARQRWDLIERARGEGIWPRRLARPPDFRQLRVLVVRRDRFGDMMVSLPLLGRLRASGARIKIFASCRTARRLIDAIGLDCASELGQAREYDPQLILFLQTCRHFRSTRHHERWDFLEDLLRAFRSVPCAIPAVWPEEAMSLPTTIAGPPLSRIDALSLLERFGDGLGLPAPRLPVLAHWIRSVGQRRDGAVVMNLSFRPASRRDPRGTGLAFWDGLHRAIREEYPTFALVHPDDRERIGEFERARLAGAFAGCRLMCEHGIERVAEWLGGQRLLVSPEGGICHLARNLELPMVVLAPRKLLPLWYPPSPRMRAVCARCLRAISLEKTVAASRELLVGAGGGG